MKYHRGFIAFMDILGFKKYLCNEDNGIDKVYSVFEFAEKISYLFNTSDINDIKIEFFSDSFVLTTEEEDLGAFTALLIACHMINLGLFKETKLCTRGAITRGEFFHKKGMVFGPGIVKAYVLESKEAKYVRMIVDEEVTNIVNNSLLINRAEDGCFEVNWFMIAIQDAEKKDGYHKEIGLELAGKYKDSIMDILVKNKNTQEYYKYLPIIKLFNNFCNNMEYYEDGGYKEFLIDANRLI